MSDNVSSSVELSSLQGGYTLQMVTADTVFEGESQMSQAVYKAHTHEPGVAQTLLNIANAEMVAGDETGVEDLHGMQDIVKLEEEGSSVIRLEDASDEQKKLATDSIRAQIAGLCGQLSDLGEECFLLSVRLADEACQHVGSVKGDHYCLLHPELLKDFSNFCHGVESEITGEEKEQASECVFPEEPMEEDTYEVKQHMEDVITIKEEPTVVTPSRAVKPKVIVLKKTVDGKVAPDHQYVMDENKVSTESGDSEAGSSSDTAGKHCEKENQQLPGPNILFICNICKSVFNNVLELRQHKKDDHQETDSPCNKCNRVFTLQRSLDKHQLDAHFDDTRFICDSCIQEFKTGEELAMHIDDVHDSDLPMRCDVCEQTFTDLPNLMSHRKIHFDYACFCTKCWQGFFDCLELETHQQHTCQYKEALYKCYICGKKFTKLSLISKHVDSHPVHCPHVCRMCARGFDSEKELKNHRMAAHIIRPYKCEVCEKTFKKKEALIEHRRIHLTLTLKQPGGPGASVGNVLLAGHTDRVTFPAEFDGESQPQFECPTCGITLSTQSLLDQHMNKHDTATEQFKCDSCDKIFFSENLLSLHSMRDHKVLINNKGNPSMQDLKMCDWVGCNKTFYDRNKLRQHMKYHEQRADKIARGIPLNPQKSLTKCEICGKILKYKSYLKAHMLSHTDKLPYQCDLCGQAYPSSKRLADHIRTHNGEKPYKCKLCDKAFTSSSLCNQHMVVHWGHKKFICDVCGKGFMSRKHFHDHLRIHAGEQQYRCDICNKEFIYYRSLVRHNQVHIDPKVRQKPYKCEFCQKEYTEVTGYKHHMRSVHTGENPYQCEFCGESFHRNDKLKRHLKTRHNMNDLKQRLIVTTRRQSGAPVIVRAEAEQREDLLQQPNRLLQIVQGGDGVDDSQNELHVDVIQDGAGQQQVFLIGLGDQEGGETTYLQETQVIEGPDGVRYIIAGSGEELQVIESGNIQQLSEGDVLEGSVVQQGEENVLIMNDGSLVSSDQETLNTLANMASVAEVAQQQE